MASSGILGMRDGAIQNLHIYKSKDLQITEEDLCKIIPSFLHLLHYLSIFEDHRFSRTLLMKQIHMLQSLKMNLEIARKIQGGSNDYAKFESLHGSSNKHGLEALT